MNAHIQERYVLRSLLHHVKGPRSFEEIRTVNGEICPTYHAACVRLGLFDDNTEIKKAMTEASNLKFGHALRQLFSTLLLHAKPVDPLSLWEEFKVELCRDYMQPNKLSEPTPEMVNKVLLELQDIFAAAGIDIVKQFHLPCPTKPTCPAGKGEAKEIQVELDYSAQELAGE